VNTNHQIAQNDAGGENVLSPENTKNINDAYKSWEGHSTPIKGKSSKY
jgi:hypothetical protein